MRNVALTGILTLFLSVTASAQLTYGPMLGLGANVISVNANPEPAGFDAENSSGFGFFVGGFAAYDLGDGLFARPELHLAIRRFSDKEDITETDTDFFGNTVQTRIESDFTSRDTFLEIPLLMGYEFSEGLSVLAGPSVGLLLGSRMKGEQTITIDGDSYTDSIDDSGTTGRRGAELGLALGLHYELPMGLSVGVRYTRALTNILENNEFGGIKTRQNYNLIRVNFSYLLDL